MTYISGIVLSPVIMGVKSLGRIASHPAFSGGMGISFGIGEKRLFAFLVRSSSPRRSACREIPLLAFMLALALFGGHES